MGISQPVDLRSDTVTRPSAAMRRAMADAEVGDDVLDGDPTTKRLESRVAEMLDAEAALFFPSGTQANQTALHVLGTPGTEVICDSESHVIHYEKAGMAVMSGLQIRPVDTERGFLRGDDLRAALRTSRYEPVASMVVIENTHNLRGGTVMECADLEGVGSAARDAGLPVHLDGARLWNAAVAGPIPLAHFSKHVTTTMVSFSKGLGCPVGSILTGPGDIIDRAWHVRKMLGGGMRQSGVLAAACLVSLDGFEDRIATDHAKARAIVDALREKADIRLVEPATNIVMLDLGEPSAVAVATELERAGVLVVAMGSNRLRLVTHADVTEEEVRWAAQTIERVLSGK
ncbi:MAG: threonine aldolase family protein [Gemmatimonadales bacterium]